MSMVKSKASEGILRFLFFVLNHTYPGGSFYVFVKSNSSGILQILLCDMSHCCNQTRLVFLGVFYWVRSNYLDFYVFLVGDRISWASKSPEGTPSVSR